MRPRTVSGFLVISQTLLLTSIVCVSQTTTPSAMSWALEPDAQNERLVLQYLSPMLVSANKAGRIYYEAVCTPGTQNPVPFPRVDVRSPSGNGADSATVRSIFRDSSSVTVNEDTSGTIRIGIGKAPDTILHTRITHLSLDRRAQYYPMFALFAIEGAPDVQAAMKELDIPSPLKFFIIGVPPPTDEQPHLPAELSNLTMDEALDMVATTWKGIVLYGACSPSGTFRVSFAPAARRDN